jgi:hypothetical protein
VGRCCDAKTDILEEGPSISIKPIESYLISAVYDGSAQHAPALSIQGEKAT